MIPLLFCLSLKLAGCPAAGLPPVYTPPPYVAPAPVIVGYCVPVYVLQGKVLVQQGAVCVN